MARERPTILQIIPRLDTGGAEFAVVEITDAIVRAGGRALVATEGGRLADSIRVSGGEIIPFPAATKNPVTVITNARALARLVGERDIDLIHARSRAPAWSALLAARRTSRPFVTTYHGAYGETNAVKRFYNSVMARSDIIIANSRFTAELVRSRYATPSGRIEVIHRGIDPERFSPDRVDETRIAALRSTWRLEPQERVILHLARLTRWKGQSVLIQAAALLRSQGLLNKAVVILAGDCQGRNDYLSVLEARIRRMDLGDRVRLVGHVDDVAAACRLAFVTIVASTEPEAFGRAAIEAHAMTSPVIATDIGAPPEIVRAAPRWAPNETTGWLVPPGNVEALARRLGEALTMSPAARIEMGERARSLILKTFTLNTMKQQTLAVYDRLLESRLATRFASLSSIHDPVAQAVHQS
jgi:glycosyltransferase involved in cell wall biosynthesis